MLPAGTSVVFTFPPLPELHYETLAETAEMIETRLRAKMTIPMINRPQGMIFPIEQFYDSANYL